MVLRSGRQSTNAIKTESGKGRQKGLLDLEEPIHFDLVIIDEAHHIRHSTTGAYQVARYFTDNADAVVMLTATPVAPSTTWVCPSVVPTPLLRS